MSRAPVRPPAMRGSCSCLGSQCVLSIRARLVIFPCRHVANSAASAASCRVPPLDYARRAKQRYVDEIAQSTCPAGHASTSRKVAMCRSRYVPEERIAKAASPCPPCLDDGTRPPISRKPNGCRLARDLPAASRGQGRTATVPAPFPAANAQGLSGSTHAICLLMLRRHEYLAG